jgi:hypothetical protein
MVMLLRLWWRHQPWLRLWLRWRHHRRLLLVLKSVEVVVGLR